MKILKQLTIILFITFLGEALHQILPLPIPSSIYGLLLMLGALCTHIVKLEDVKIVGTFFLDTMTVFFIPITVELLVSWSKLEEMLVPAVLTITVSTLIVMAVSGTFTQKVVDRKEARNHE